MKKSSPIKEESKKVKENLFVKHLSNGWNVFFQDVIKGFLKLIPLVVIILV